jgi:hypothetical protein
MVNTLIASANRLYAGGSFNSWIPGPLSGLVAYDLGSGLRRSDFPTVYGSVSAVISDDNGGWFVGGEFSGVGNVLAQNLAHILPDLTVDPDFTPNPDNHGVATLMLLGDTLYVGGWFTTIGSQLRSAIAAIDVRTGQVTPWNPNATSPNPLWSVGYLVYAGQHIYVAGDFYNIGGQPRQSLAALDLISGQATDWNPALATQPSEEVAIHNLLADGDDVLVAWEGRIPRIIPPNGKTYDSTWRLALFDTQTGQRKPWDPNPVMLSNSNPGGVSYMTAVGGTLYVAGAFEQIGGQSRYNLAALDLNTGLATSWDPNQANLSRGSQLIAGGPIFVVGDVLYIDGRIGNSGAGTLGIDVTTGLAWPWQAEPTDAGGMWPLHVSGGVFLGSQSAYSTPVPVPGSASRPMVAALDSTTGALLDWQLPLSQFGAVNALAADQSNVYLGGSGLALAGNPTQSLSGFLSAGADTGELEATPAGLNLNSVDKLTVAGAQVYLAASATSDPADLSHILVCLNRDTGTTNWVQTVDQFIWDLKVSGDTVYIAGSFGTVGGQVRHGLAALSAQTGVLADWNPAIQGSVLSLALMGDRVLLGGDMKDVGGQGPKYLAAVDPLSGGPLDLDFAPDGRVSQLVLGHDTLVLAGDFNHVNGTQRGQLAAIDLESGSLTDWNPSPNHAFIDPFSIAITDNVIAVTGPFTTIGGRYRPKFAIFPLVGTPEIINRLEDTQAAVNQDIQWSVQAVGEQPFTYQWTFNGAAIPGATGSAFTLANARLSDSGVYAVVVSNSVGSVTSRPIKCRVLEPVSNVQGPVSQIVDVGGTTVLSVNASGSGPLAYQWRLNGANLPGEVFSSVQLTEDFSPFLLTKIGPWQAGSYSVAVANSLGTVSSAPAEVTLRLPALPFADRFADAGTVTGLSFLGAGDNRSATTEAGEPRHASQDGGKSIWLRWQPPASGIAVLDTRGSSFDTLLAVYTGTDLAGLGEIAADNDSGGYFTSLVTFNAVKDTEYDIAVDGMSGASGDVVLNATLSPSADKVPDILTAPQNQVVSSGQNVVFTVVVSNVSPVQYQWFLNGSALPAATNSTLMLNQVTPDNVGLYWVEMSNAAGVVRTEPVTLQLSSADALDVAAHDKVGETLVLAPVPGLQSLLSSTPTQRRAVSPSLGIAGFKVFSTFGATKEPGEPNHCGRIGGASYWLALQPPVEGLLSISTEGSDFDTLLTVYTAQTDGSWKEVASDDNSGQNGQTSFLRFAATAGTVYYVAVDGFNDAKGLVRLAYVLDGRDSAPRVRIASVSGGGKESLELTVQGQTSRSYRLQTSTDLQHWSSLITTNLASAAGFALAQDSLHASARFYRVVPVP